MLTVTCRNGGEAHSADDATAVGDAEIRRSATKRTAGTTRTTAKSTQRATARALFGLPRPQSLGDESVASVDSEQLKTLPEHTRTGRPKEGVPCSDKRKSW